MAGSEGLSWFKLLARSGRLPALVAAIGCAILLYGFLLSGDFAIDDVTVRGAQIGDPVEIAASTGAFGESVFQVESDQVAQRLAALPYVERVDVETRLPSRLVVSVTERTPVLVWQTSEQAFLIDSRGQVLAAGNDAGLPLVDSGAIDVKIGGTIGPERVAAVHAVQEALGAQLESMTWDEREGLKARLQDDRVVIFGEPDQLPLKLAVYQELRPTGLTWEVLDLREPDRPYYK